jgi:kumamolisin
MPDTPMVLLPGSERSVLPGTRVVGPIDQSEWIEVTVITRRRAPLPHQGGMPVRICREELWQHYGSDPADQQLVGHVLSMFGLGVISQESGTRRMALTGTVSAFNSAFGAQLTLVASPHPSGTGVAVHRYRTGGLLIPPELDGIVEAVLGLDNRPQARPHAQRADPAAVTVSYTPPQVASIYQFPTGTDGTGQHLAIIELGGGFSQDDLDLYFPSLGLATPSVTVVCVDGAGNMLGHGR